MTEKKLTNGYIRKYDELLRLDLLNNNMFKKHQFLLIIQANTREFSRFMIYPINVDKILKITVSSLKENVEELKLISSILKNVQIIHNSGLKLSFSDSKYNDLKISLDKIKNKYIDIDIEEITLNN
jgi:hypothetical protein